MQKSEHISKSMNHVSRVDGINNYEPAFTECFYSFSAMKTHFIKNKRCEAKKAVPKNMMTKKDGPDNYGRGGSGGGNFRGGSGGK